MRTTIVPAQITTIEDRIAGNLTLVQILLLLTPLIMGSIIYLIFPPQLHFSFYKLPLMAFCMLVFSSLAIRIKGKIIISWIIILIRYNTRAKFYVANKNDNYLREEQVTNTDKNYKKEIKASIKEINSLTPQIPLTERIKLEHILPKANMRVLFNKKGEAYVRLSEVK